MEKTTVTALMPLKNHHPRFLKTAIQSILDQSCPDWRLWIIVEEPDYRYFSEFLQRELFDSRIEMIVNQGRKLAGALNTGMRHAKTGFAGILLADDLWSCHAVETLHRYIGDFSEIDFFHSSRRYIDADDRPISSVYLSRQSFSVDDFKVSSPVKHLLCWRISKALMIGGMDESLNSVGADDYDFPWSMAETGAKFMAIRECLYVYRDHRECYRLTTHLPLSVHKREIARIMRKHGVADSFIKSKISAAQSGYLRQCLYRSALDKWIKHIRGAYPRRAWRERYS